MRFGTLRGLDACASQTGRFSVLALDHRGSLRKLLNPNDPAAVPYDDLASLKSSIVRAMAGSSSGVLLDPEIGTGPVIADGSLGACAGLLVAVEQTGYGGPTTERRTQLLPAWGVGQIKRIGADAVKLLLYYHPDAANADDQERLLMEVAEICADEDIALFLETLSYSIDPDVASLTGEARRDVVVRTARRLTALGGDILKCEFPYDASVTDPTRWSEGCAELEEASSIPWVILSAGVDDATFEAQTAVACRSGASGVMVGRSVWKESVTMPSPERERWLETEGVARMERLVAIVEAEARPWRERSALPAQTATSEGWHQSYPG